MPPVLEPSAVNHPIDLRRTAGCRLWIDGAGCWMLWFRRELVFGNAAPSRDDTQRFRILADLRTRHAAWFRDADGDFLRPAGTVAVNGVQLERETALRSGDQIQLGQDVILRFTVPSPLSRTSVVGIESGHRTADRCDGLILLEETCLIGPGEQCHIRCENWDETIVLFERDDRLWYQGRRPGSAAAAVTDGFVIAGEHGRMRFELPG